MVNYVELMTTLKTNDCVFVGDVAYNHYTGSTSLDKLAVLCENHTALAEKLMLRHPGARKSMFQDDFKDLRLERIKLQWSDVILYIYNSTQYELVPYTTHDGLKIATCAVVARFLALDLWNVCVIKHRTGKQAPTSVVSNIRDKLYVISGVDADDSVEYAGTHTPENIHKRTTSQSDKSHIIYIPHYYKKQHGAYWQV